jgi:pSer/pThr/pTyr-binding forkhead associated (FHA) protein
VPLPEGHYLLLSKGGVFQSFHLLDNDLVVIGRNKDSHIVIDSPHISRLHCIIDKNDMVLELRDMNSRNGVTVNYERVQKRALCDGDVITIGKFDMIYFINESTRAKTALRKQLIPSQNTFKKLKNFILRRKYKVLIPNESLIELKKRMETPNRANELINYIIKHYHREQGLFLVKMVSENYYKIQKWLDRMDK